jgi:hypothetical protein
MTAYDNGVGPRGVPLGRRARNSAKRCRRVEFSLTDEEFEDLDAAAARAGLARGAYAAEAALSVARGVTCPADNRSVKPWASSSARPGWYGGSGST